MLSEHSLTITAMTASLQKTTEKTVEQTAAKHAKSQGGLLPCLHEIQTELGYIPVTTWKVSPPHFRSLRQRFMASSVSITTLERHHLLRRVSKFAVPKPVRRRDHANWRLASQVFWVLSLMKRTQRITTASSEYTVWVIVPAAPRFASMTMCMGGLISQAYRS